MDKLPSEIIQLVIYHLDQNQSSLAHVNVSCKSLYYDSLQQLYRAPTFSTIQRFRSFVQNLSKKAGECVRTVDLSLTAHRWEPSMNALVMTLSQKAKNIEHLNLCLCHIGHSVLYSCASELKQLQYLSVNGNRHLDDTTMACLVPKLKELRGLDIGATAIRDRTLILIAKHCTKLETLDVSDCHRITEKGLRCVTTQLPHLNYLSIKNCYNVVSMDGEFDGIAVEEDEYEDVDDEEDNGDDIRDNDQGVAGGTTTAGSSLTW